MPSTLPRIATSLFSAFLLLGSTGDVTASPPGDFNVSQAPDSNIATLRKLLDQPEEQIDLARAKVTIDHMVDPKIDANGMLRQLDQ
ncbi:hypothetical protein [Xanthomonas sp. 3075]|uniref:hypothetical protein n=1 Tax=Xanthomonas sp. 3075 TaxID=3035315 RepID=UPI0017FF3B5B|nr:hypothetical protein [Xanthomonas sp. 3075]MBB4131841.1 hypothetical protein [Xanthomonas sp. 3075]